MKDKSGFTLIEMSVVLAIIGLIVGGIVAGQSLIRSAQLRDAVSEYDTYLKGIKEYQDKYMALPGDDSNAHNVWAAATSGDGNGQIGTSTTAGVLGAQGEWWQAWLHLSLAGFVPGNFSGTATANTAVVGTNVPASKLSGAGWTLNYFLMTTADTSLWRDQYGHLLNLGAYKSGDYTKNPVLTPAEALGIDIKLDDGMPGTGKVRAWRTSVLPNCTIVADDTSQTAQTYSTNSGLQCALVFLLGF